MVSDTSFMIISQMAANQRDIVTNLRQWQQAYADLSAQVGRLRQDLADEQERNDGLSKAYDQLAGNKAVDGILLDFYRKDADKARIREKMLTDRIAKLEGLLQERATTISELSEQIYRAHTKAAVFLAEREGYKKIIDKVREQHPGLPLFMSDVDFAGSDGIPRSEATATYHSTYSEALRTIGIDNARLEAVRGDKFNPAPIEDEPVDTQPEAAPRPRRRGRVANMGQYAVAVPPADSEDADIAPGGFGQGL